MGKKKKRGAEQNKRQKHLVLTIPAAHQRLTHKIPGEYDIKKTHQVYRVLIMNLQGILY